MDDRPNVLLLDGGDLFGLRNEVERAQTDFLLGETAKLGYGVFGVGEFDLNYGLGYLRAAEEEHGFTFVNANLRARPGGPLLFPPYEIVEVAGLRVGLVSVIDPSLDIVTMSATADQFVADSPRDALERVLPELREEADLVVLLGHMQSGRIHGSQERDEGLRGLLTALGEGHGIDVAVEGHDVRQYQRPTWVGDTLLLAANNEGKYIGQADMLVSRDGDIVRDSVVLEIHALGKDMPDDEAVLARVEAAKEQLAKRKQEVASFVHPRPEGDPTDRFLGQATCGRCHTGVLRAEVQGPHVRAFQSLVSKGQDRNADCVGCHVTGFWHPNGYDQVADPAVPGRDLLRNVQCEGCHGAGTEHARDGSWAAAARESCQVCHDSQNDPDFDFARDWAKIAHPTPGEGTGR